MDMAICANLFFLHCEDQIPKVSQLTWILIWAHTNTLHSSSRSSTLSNWSSTQMPVRSSRTQVPISHCAKKSPQHIAVVSQDEWMTLAADVGALLFRPGIRLPSLARLWPLGESPVLIQGMLWLTCLVTPALTPAAALHSVLGVCVSSHCNCSCVSHQRPVSVCKYACSVQCIFCTSPRRLFWHRTPAVWW